MNSEMRRSIMASVIASILVIIFIQPLLRVGWSAILWLSDYVGTGFSNSIYRRAALGDRNWVDVLNSVFFLFILLIVIRAMTLPMLRRHEHTASAENTQLVSRPNWFLIATNLVMAFVVLNLIIGMFTDLQLNTSFRQRLAVLAPALSEAEEELLQAQWAGMTSRHDYDAIQRRMELLANERGVKLPKPLLR